MVHLQVIISHNSVIQLGGSSVSYDVNVDGDLQGS